MAIFGLRYQPYDLSSAQLMGPYDFFAASPLLPYFLIVFVVLVGYLLRARRFLDATLITGMLLVLVFDINYPYLVHHNVFAHDAATIEMLKQGGTGSVSIQSADLWPGFFYVSGFLLKITGLDIVTINDLMLSLFVMLMGLTEYCFAKKAYDITKNRAVMYAPVFMWIFLFNNRVLYEFMFHHQWYSLVLFALLMYILLQHELPGKKLASGRALFISLIIILTAITIMHPITGFVSTIMLLLYAIFRRGVLTAALASMFIYVSWWTFVSYTYFGYAWQWIGTLLQSGILANYATASFSVAETLPLYGEIARYMYKAYFGIAILVSVIVFLAILFKKIDTKRTIGVALVPICACLSVILFAPFGISSVWWKDRIYWIIPFPLALTFTIGLVLLTTKFGRNKTLKFIKKKSNGILLLVTLMGLISSSLLLFENNYYTLYYSPASNFELGKWVVMHTDNGTSIAVGSYFTLVDYYSVVYQKDLQSAPVRAGSTIGDMLQTLTSSEVVVYTRHMEYALEQGNPITNLSDTLRMDCIIYADGLNKIYLNSTFGTRDSISP
jgi:hypothetical protein